VDFSRTVAVLTFAGSVTVTASCHLCPPKKNGRILRVASLAPTMIIFGKSEAHLYDAEPTLDSGIPGS
jgi:hypothetical protein